MAVVRGKTLAAKNARPLGQPKRNQNKGNKGKQNQGKRGGGQPRARGLYAPNEVLEGPRLRDAIQKAIKMQVRPAVREGQRTIADINKERGQAVSREQNLSRQAGANIASYYDKLKTDEAEKLAGVRDANKQAREGIASSGRETLAGVMAAGKNATEGIGSYEGQSIASRDRLQQMIAMQESGVATQNNALNAQAQQTGASWEGLMGALAGAAQMRGGAILGDTQRQILGNIQGINQEADANVKGVRDTIKELMLKRPELAAQLLSEFREKERNFILSKGALNLEKKKTKSELAGESGGIAYSNVNLKNQLKYLKAKEKKRERELEQVGASEEQRQREHERFRERELELINAGGDDKSGADGYKSFNSTFSYLRGSPFKGKYFVEGYTSAESGKKYSAQQARTQAYDKLRKFGATDEVARKAIKRMAKRYKRGRRNKGAPSGPQGPKGREG